MLPHNVKVLTPSLVRDADDAPSVNAPVIALAAVLVILNRPCKRIVVALNAAVLIVMLPKAVVPPTAALKVVLPAPVLIDKALPAVLASIVDKNETLLAVVVNVVDAPKVTAPV